MDKDTLVADVHCPPGFVLGDTGTNWKTVTCLEDPTSSANGARWSTSLKECICEYQNIICSFPIKCKKKFQMKMEIGRYFSQ